MGHSLHSTTLRIFAWPSRSIISRSLHIIQGPTDKPSTSLIRWKEPRRNPVAYPQVKSNSSSFRYMDTPNNNTPSSLPPAELMYARKIRSMFDKLLPKQTKPGRTNTVPKKSFQPGENFFFRIFRDNKSFWEIGTIEKKVGNIIYTIKGSQFTNQKYLKQIRKRLSDDADSGPPKE